jgi:hypothetical protein
MGNVFAVYARALEGWDVLMKFSFMHDEVATRMRFDVLGWHAGSKPKAEPKKKETLEADQVIEEK